MSVSAHTRIAKTAFSDNLKLFPPETPAGEEERNLYLGLHALASALEELEKRLAKLEHQLHDIRMKQPV